MKPSWLTDQAYLQNQQYRNATNLKARIHIHQLFSTNHYDWFLWVFDRLALPPEARVVEVGCGPGELWKKNLARLPVGWQITLTDLSPGMARQARENLETDIPKIHFASTDAQRLPFPSSSFDAVIANHMLYHLPDLEAGLSELSRVLRPGGVLYAATNDREHMQELVNLVNGFMPGLNFGVKNYIFSLVDGKERLAPYFSEVSLERYDDALLVTEADPLVDYVLSMSSAYGSSLHEQARGFYGYVQAEMIRQGGAIRIRKDVGLFKAIK